MNRMDAKRTPARSTILMFGLVALVLSGCSGMMTAVRTGYEAQRAYDAGLARYTSGDHAGATPLFEQAVRLDPTYDDARAYLAWSYYFTGDYPQATKQFRLAIARQPRWAGLHDGLGWSRYRAGRYSLAMDAFREAVSLESGYRDARVGLAYALFALERYDDARPLLATLVREGEKTSFQRAVPDEEDVRARYAWTLYYLGAFQEARAQFVQGLAAQPGWAGLHNGLGWTVLRLGHRASAQQSFRQALALRPDFEDAQQGLELARR